MVINMKNSLIIFLFILSFTNLQASHKQHITKEKKGQRYYMKECSACHGSGTRGGNLASQREWKDMFFDNAKDLKVLHKDEDDTKEVIDYLNSKNFKHERKRLLKFLQEFAWDSDDIPTCN